MKKTLDHKSFIPLYHQLKEIIEENIRKGIWQQGDKILSENELREKYEISRNTVQKALDDLVQDGVLERKKGLGTFVARPKIEQPLTGFYSFSKVIESQGMVAEDTILGIDIIMPDSNLIEILNISEGEEIYSLKRIRKADNEPIMLETSYLPKKQISKLEEEDFKVYSLYDLLEIKYGITVVKAKETFEPVLLREEESEHLEVDEESPGLLLYRTAYDMNGQVVEYCRSIIRGDRCRFYTELL